MPNLKPAISHDAVRELYAQGLTPRQIGERLGYVTRTVQRTIVTLGLRAPRERYGRRLTPEDLTRIEELLDEGLSRAEIARTLNISTSTLERRYRGRGWTLVQAGAHGRAIRTANQQMQKMGLAA